MVELDFVGLGFYAVVVSSPGRTGSGYPSAVFHLRTSNHGKLPAPRLFLRFFFAQRIPYIGSAMGKVRI